MLRGQFREPHAIHVEQRIAQHDDRIGSGAKGPLEGGIELACRLDLERKQGQVVGMASVAALTAAVGWPEVVTIRSGFSATSSAASASTRSGFPSVQRHSTVTLRPSTRPRSFKPSVNPYEIALGALLMKPIRGVRWSGCRAHPAITAKATASATTVTPFGARRPAPVRFQTARASLHRSTIDPSWSPASLACAWDARMHDRSPSRECSARGWSAGRRQRTPGAFPAAR